MKSNLNQLQQRLKDIEPNRIVCWEFIPPYVGEESDLVRDLDSILPQGLTVGVFNDVKTEQKEDGRKLYHSLTFQVINENLL